MTVEKRLQSLEKATTALPRSGAQLLREVKTIADNQKDAWLAALTDEELLAYCQALDEERWAAGLPVYDMTVLTDEELQRVSLGDKEPLAKCPVLPPPNQYGKPNGPALTGFDRFSAANSP